MLSNPLLIASLFFFSTLFIRAHDFSVAKFDDRTVILCDQVFGLLSLLFWRHGHYVFLVEVIL